MKKKGLIKILATNNSNQNYKMGIKDLKALIKKHSPNGIENRNLSHYANKTIAIDTSIYFYRFLAYGNHLSGFVRQILLFLENGITPLYVFDGKPPVEKSEILLERKARREKDMNLKKDLEAQISCCSDAYEIKVLNKKLFELNRRLIFVTSEHIDSAKELFKLFGIPFLHANGEAEILCAKLCQQGYVYGCLSEDTDLLPNGSKIFINNFKMNQKFVIEFNLENILQDLALTHEQFIDLCILCGCDYTCKIEGLAKDGAYKMIKKYINIEGVINFIKYYNKKHQKTKYQVPDDFNFQRAREIFHSPIEELIDVSTIRTKRQPVKSNDLMDYVSSNCTHLAKRYHSQVEKLCKNNKITKIESINQFSGKTIDQYFTPL